MEISSTPNTPVAGEKKKRSTVTKWALILGIAIVVNLFLTYLVDVLYNAPEYTVFCPEKQVNEAIETEAACLKVGGQWNENIQPKVESPGMPIPAGYCDPTFTCSKQFQDTLSVYNRNVFIVFVLAGILLLMGSVYLGQAEVISLGLSFGGILALVVGSTRYWSDMNDILRVIILGVALAGLLYVAWKKFKD